MANLRRSSKRATAVVLALGVVATTLVFATGTASAQGLSIDNPDTYGAEVGNPFCVNIEVSGAVGDVTVSVTGGFPTPPGVSVTSHAFGDVPGSIETRWALTGRPTSVGEFNFSVTATDDVDSVTETFIISVVEESPDDIVVAAGRLGTGYTIDCASQGREAHGLLRSLSAFGGSGTVLSRLAVREWTRFNDAAGAGNPITNLYLDGVDILLDGWVENSAWTPRELPLIEDWVNAGGVLIAAEDHSRADRLGEVFGAPTNSEGLCVHVPSEVGDPPVACPTITSVGSGPVVAGPFGDWSGDSLGSSGTVGNYTAVPPGWEVIARSDRAGSPAVVITRPYGLGRVILLADEALWRTQSFPELSNRTFVGNLIAYAIDEIGEGALPIDVTDDAITVGTGQAIPADRRDLCANDASSGTISVASWSSPLPAGVSFDTATCRLSGRVSSSFVFWYRVTTGDNTATAAVTVAATPTTCNGRAVTIVGGVTQAVVNGTRGADVIVTTNPNGAVINARGGSDVVCGGRGSDTITGGKGADVLLGAGGADTLRGGRGTDECMGGRGRDLADTTCEVRISIARVIPRP